MNNQSAKVEFPAPKGFVPPETDDPDGDWDMVSTYRTDRETGKICLVKLGDTPMPSYDEGSKPESKPGYDGMAKDMMSQQIAGSDESA